MLRLFAVRSGYPSFPEPQLSSQNLTPRIPVPRAVFSHFVVLDALTGTLRISVEMLRDAVGRKNEDLRCRVRVINVVEVGHQRDEMFRPP